MTWHPITEKPETVGRYVVKDRGFEFRAQWDGRHFRWLSTGMVMFNRPDDQWRKEESHVSV